MLKIAVTGGIGSGKSTVVDLFRAYSIAVIDTDIISRELVEHDTQIKKSIASHFGPEIFTADGRLQRKQLREIVFNNPQQREQLEEILHPAIHKKVLAELSDLTAAYCLIVIPLLFETKYPYPYDRILVIDSSEQQQIARTMARDQTQQTDVENIMKVQCSRQYRLQRADDVIHNDGDLEQLRSQVEKLHQFYLSIQ